VAELTGDDQHEFDKLTVTESIGFLEKHGIVLTAKKRESFRNALFYQHFFQYRGGDLYRAILGRDAVFDREWEENACKLLQFTGRSLLEMRGPFWRWNDWNKDSRFATILCKPEKKTKIWIRISNYYVDIEGPIILPDGSEKNGVLTMHSYHWNRRYKSLFKEVRLDHGNERSTYCGRTTCWRLPPREWRDPEVITVPAHNMSSVWNVLGRKTLPSASESVQELPEILRDGLVSRPWRVLTDFSRPNVKPLETDSELQDWIKQIEARESTRPKTGKMPKRKKLSNWRKTLYQGPSGEIKPPEFLKA
jgi:hypothetical protein